MNNLELVRWEVKDRAAAQQRMAEEARLAAGSDASKPSGQHIRAFVSLLIGIVGVLAWLAAQQGVRI